MNQYLHAMFPALSNRPTKWAITSEHPSAFDLAATSPPRRLTSSLIYLGNPGLNQISKSPLAAELMTKSAETVPTENSTGTSTIPIPLYP